MRFVIAIDHNDHNEAPRAGPDAADSRYFVVAFRISFEHTCRRHTTALAN